MAMQPLITFKAGRVDLDETDNKTLTVRETPGFVYLYIDPEEGLTHFCWTPRANTTNEPELDLITFPGDLTFTPYKDPKSSSSSDTISPTNGRIFKLKFSSSQDRYFFWLQSKPNHPSGKPNYFSERDLKLGAIVNDILQGEEVDVQAAMASGGGGDEDEEMGDDNGLRRTSTGGAGPDATGGDFREEGEESRGGGADGARAASGNLPTDANDAVQNFLRSLGGGGAAAGGSYGQQPQQKLFTTLPDLLTPEACIATLTNATPAYLDSLLSHLPPQLLTLAQSADDLTSFSTDSTTAETGAAAAEALSVEQKKDLLKRVFRSPQLYQSLGSLTMALRDGGLPMVADALKIKVENGGLIRGGAMPLGDGAAVEAFLEGVKKTVKEEDKDGNMDTS